MTPQEAKEYGQYIANLYKDTEEKEIKDLERILQEIKQCDENNN